jgi:hypothetical protein
MQSFHPESLFEKLRECDQDELVEHLQSSSHDVNKLKSLFNQINNLEKFYDGGLKSYVTKVR